MRLPSRPSARTTSASDAGVSMARGVPLTVTCMGDARSAGASITIAVQRLAHEIELLRKARAHIAQRQVGAQLQPLPEPERAVLPLGEQPGGLLARDHVGDG